MTTSSTADQHLHPHSGDHDHPHTHEPHVGVSPMLDIGGDVGALVVYLSEIPRSGELELCPTGEPSGRFHTGVHLRPFGPSLVAVAVFPAVRTGTYDVLDPQGIPMAAIAAAGGEVRELDLR